MRLLYIYIYIYEDVRSKFLRDEMEYCGENNAGISNLPSLSLVVVVSLMTCGKCGKELSPDNFRKKKYGEYTKNCNKCLDIRKCEHLKLKDKCEICLEMKAKYLKLVVDDVNPLPSSLELNISNTTANALDQRTCTKCAKKLTPDNFRKKPNGE